MQQEQQYAPPSGPPPVRENAIQGITPERPLPERRETQAAAQADDLEDVKKVSGTFPRPTLADLLGSYALWASRGHWLLKH